MKTNNNLTPIFDGRVLVNETALHDQAVIEFKHTWGGESVNISDRD